MLHLAPLIKDLAVILSVAAAVTYIFKWIKQPVVLGYIVAGVIVGPYTPPIFSVIDTENVKVWAELGVILLMFNLGLEFSFRRLLKIGASAAFTGIFQIIVMIYLGYHVAGFFGWTTFDAVFLGCMIAVSSTTIIIKAFEELNLKHKRFAELVFGILIVEDLAAIVMLVGLTNFAAQSQVSALEMAVLSGKLFFVVSLWILTGIFLVPRVVAKVANEGNDEMLTVTSLALCFGLVTVAAYFDYSVALGAFIMGSILSETRQVKRIEHLVMPLKDVFGAIFFVSVGMLLDPGVIVANFSQVFLISAVIIAGKIISVSIGTLLTGQTVQTSVQTGFSMAQIGEFSFIIAALGQNLGVISPQLYPIIVASSLVTTFTTPYLVRASLGLTEKIEPHIPKRLMYALDRYRLWFQRSSVNAEQKKTFARKAVKALGNGIMVLAIFILSSKHVVRWLDDYMPGSVARLAAWGVAMAAASPFLWAILATFRAEDRKFLSLKQKKLYIHFPTLASFSVVLLFTCLISAEFFSGWVSLALFLTAFSVLFVFFRGRVKRLSGLIERRFLEVFEKEEALEHPADHELSASLLVPWDAHLVPLVVPPTAPAVGKTLLELNLRETYGVNVVAITRGLNQIVAPGADVRVYPFDRLLCFASDREIAQMDKDLFNQEQMNTNAPAAPVSLTLRRVVVPQGSWLAGRSIKESGLSATYNCLVVGVERDLIRIKSPRADFGIKEADILWVICSEDEIHRFVGSLAKV